MAEDAAHRTIWLDRLLVGTLLSLALLMPGSWYVIFYLRGAAIAGCLFANVRREPLFWVALAAFEGAGIAIDWTYADNHRYLAVYWSLALALGLSQSGAAQWDCLRVQSRLLLGLVSLFATGWKLSSGEYLSGDFFEYTLLTDDRFSAKVHHLLGVPAADLRANRELVDTLLTSVPDLAQPITSGRLLSSPWVRPSALFLTWSAVLLEGALALVFLCPTPDTRWGHRLNWTRDGLLWLFLAGTYLVAPVLGFGGILAMMGATQTTSLRRANIYFVLLVVLQLLEVTFQYRV